MISTRPTFMRPIWTAPTRTESRIVNRSATAQLSEDKSSREMVRLTNADNRSDCLADHALMLQLRLLCAIGCSDELKNIGSAEEASNVGPPQYLERRTVLHLSMPNK